MSGDEIDDLARRLFESAESERPSAELRSRVLTAASNRRALVASDRAAENGEQSESSVGERVAPRAVPSQRRSGWVTARWLLAAAAIGVLSLAFFCRSPSPRDLLVIAPEQRASRAVAAFTIGSPSARAPQGAGLPVPSSSSLRRVVSAPPLQTTPLPSNRAVAAPPSNSARAQSALVREKEDITATPGAPAEPGGTPVPTLGQELEWLQHARSQLRAGDSQGALRLLDSYTKDLHGLDLGAEASVLRIEALNAAGRSAEATALARRFVLENPNSPLVDRARGFLASPAAVQVPTP